MPLLEPVMSVEVVVPEGEEAECPTCHGAISIDAARCPHCAESFVGEAECPTCHGTIPEDVAECPYCGQTFE